MRSGSFISKRPRGISTVPPPLAPAASSAGLDRVGIVQPVVGDGAKRGHVERRVLPHRRVRGDPDQPGVTSFRLSRVAVEDGYAILARGKIGRKSDRQRPALLLRRLQRAALSPHVRRTEAPSSKLRHLPKIRSQPPGDASLPQSPLLPPGVRCVEPHRRRTSPRRPGFRTGRGPASRRRAPGRRANRRCTGGARAFPRRWSPLCHPADIHLGLFSPAPALHDDHLARPHRVGRPEHHRDLRPRSTHRGDNQNRSQREVPEDAHRDSPAKRSCLR